MENEFAGFLLNQGLYRPIAISKSNYTQLADLLNGKVNISLYCPSCKEVRVFSMQSVTVQVSADGMPIKTKLGDLIITEQNEHRPVEAGLARSFGNNEQNWVFPGRLSQPFMHILRFPFECAMDHSHKLDFFVKIDGNMMTKIGQYPSVADLSFPELDDFKKIIDETSRKELRRAIGLHAQGIGVGAYVYLRRIFEHILEDAKSRAEQDGNLDLSNYSIMKVQDRMKLLRAYLPEMINANPVYYGIVSKGIHELSEEDCIKYFPILKEIIFMILRQWNQKKQEFEAAKRLSSALSGISTELKSDKK